MWTTAKIRRHVMGLAKGQLFATRHCLNYGSRAAVDRALARMVHCGWIVRLAWGVFVKHHPDNPRFTHEEIARFKAMVFGRRMGTAMSEAGRLLGLPAGGGQRHVFAIDGRTTSFRYNESVIQLRGTSPRKLSLSGSKAGLVVQALWHEGRSVLSSACARALWLTLGRTDREDIRRSCSLMPAWLSDHLVHA